MAPDKVTNVDKFNIGFGIFNFVGVVVAICISIWSVNKSEDVAKRSGAFDKARLSLSFGGYFPSPGTEFEVYYGLNFNDTTLHLLELPVSIYNNGEKTAEDVHLSLKYLHTFNIALNDSIIRYESDGNNKIERKLTTLLPYDQAVFSIDAVNPNLSISPSEFICVRKEETKGEVRVPAYSKDSVLFNVTTRYSYYYPVIVSLTGKDVVTQVFQFYIGCRKDTTIQSLLSNILEEKKSQRNTENSRWDKNFFVVIPKVKDVIGGKYKLTMLKRDNADILYCLFDVEKKHVVVLSPDGQAKQLIDLEN